MSSKLTAASASALAALLLLGAACQARADARVELELVTEPGFSVTGTHRWLAALKDLGFSSLRIRSGRPGDRAEVVTTGTQQLRVYKVTGILLSGDKLLLPGGRFAIRDKAGIRAWREKLATGGEEGLDDKPAAFGLTAKQLVAVHEQLAARLTFSTKGKTPKEVIRQIARGIEMRLVVDPAVHGAFADEWTVPDELTGVSSGTALAAIVRPLGLVLVPHRAGSGTVTLIITDARKAPESWPVGWPPEKKPLEVLPKMFEFLSIAIKDTPLSEVVDALGKRLETPILLDHNALARHQIDPAAVKVTLPEGRTFYKKALDRLLYQAKLKCELRVDEAGRPLFWVSTLKK